MTREEKQLLLKDLCARLPYDTWVQYEGEEWLITGYGHGRVSLLPSVFSPAVGLCPLIEEVKPYLRPMSSMTDKERKDWYSYSRAQYDCEFHPDPTLSLFESHLSVDWLVAHHFDYRGLIPRGLAIESPDGMYKTE